MAGFLDFLHSALGGGGQGSAPPMATSGPGSAEDPFKPVPTLDQGFLAGLQAHAGQIGQAGQALQDGSGGQAQPGQDPMQQLMQMRSQRQQMLQQLLGGR